VTTSPERSPAVRNPVVRSSGMRNPESTVAADDETEALPGGTAPFGSSFMGVWRLSAYLLLTLVLAPLQAVFALTGMKLGEILPVFYHRCCCRIMGIEVAIAGAMSSVRPTLFVCNHSSYLDITVLGGIVPGCFVAKTEVANWPFFGFLAKLQRTVFVDRRRGTSHRQRDQLKERLHAGDNLILFPEGTSNDGNRVLGFRSSLLSVAETPSDHGPLIVQPVSIAYVAVNGIPMGRALRPMVAWYGGMSLGPHLWQFSRLGRVQVTVGFHPAVGMDRFASRKELTRYCYDSVADGVEAALSGRPAAAVAGKNLAGAES
jgi:1-acyl-sn-glycerol-3-phosphate acyltransferase